MFQDCHPGVTAEVSSAADYLGMAIANQLNSYPMDRLIITGRMLELGPEFQIMLEKTGYINRVDLAVNAKTLGVVVHEDDRTGNRT